GNDEVFCISDSVNPSGIGAKIPKLGVNEQCVSSRGDIEFLGCTNLKSSSAKKQTTSDSSQVQQFFLWKQRLVQST
ncbi:unnamed protein product, partial [Brassica rapa subsp. trilocularis]